MTEHFGKRLRRLRGDRSQKEVAAAIGLPTTTYASLEQQDGVPRGPVLEKLCLHLGVAVDYFFPSTDSCVTPALEWLRSRRTENFSGAPTVATNLTPDAEVTKEEKAQFDKIIGEKIAST